MKIFFKKPFHTFLITGLMFYVLFHADKAKQFAYLGLDTWFTQLIPSLLPFMILSSLLIQLDLISYFCKPFRFFLRPLFQMNDSCLYVLITGFLCGFPIGAKNITQLYQEGKLTKDEGNYLLSFCNNIGPIYFLSFVWNNVYPRNLFPYGFAILILPPLLYGLFLRYTFYRKKIIIPSDCTSSSKKKPSYFQRQIQPIQKPTKEPSFLEALDISITSSLYQISILGGYMILFNILVLFPFTLFRNNSFQSFLHSLIEISGGLQTLKESDFSTMEKFLFTHLALCFNGLCCMFQTLHFIKDTNLSGQKYMLHKTILCSITLFVILFIFLL